MHKTASFLVVGIVLGIGFGKALAEILEPPRTILVSEYSIHMAHMALSRLHYLKIGEASALEENLTRQIPTDTIILSKILDSNGLEPEEIESIRRHLVVLAVMDEKFKIEEWRENKDFQSILDSVRAKNMAHADRLRCKNWSKPMWTEPDDCA